jgi:flavin reductase (DIM6/NTAB) family NADH-FMN oxidoreductase RutF
MTPNAAALPMPELREAFIDAMSRAASMVSIVTTDGAAGRAGVTVSAMSSVSADTTRPTLMVCVNANSTAASAILANGVFCVNFLRDDQSVISDVFAGRSKDRFAEKFDCGEWRAGTTGSPTLVDALAVFDCRIAAAQTIGQHHVLFGEVEAVTTGPEGPALVYALRNYSSPRPLTA